MAHAVPKPLDTPTDLQEADLKAVAASLNGLLADSYALYLKTKNFHWHMSGPHFRDYHLLLDDQAGQILGTTDAIAERVRKLGQTTLHSIGDIAKKQSTADDDRSFVTAQDMLGKLLDDNRALIRSLREAKELVDNARDNATSGILDDWTDEAEERAWFLFEATRQAR